MGQTRHLLQPHVQKEERKKRGWEVGGGSVVAKTVSLSFKFTKCACRVLPGSVSALHVSGVTDTSLPVHGGTGMEELPSLFC